MELSGLSQNDFFQMNSRPYIPVACSLHDEYELAIMCKQCINIEWQDETGQHHYSRVIPEDIIVKNREEFLIAKTQSDNQSLCIRLDKITMKS